MKQPKTNLIELLFVVLLFSVTSAGASVTLQFNNNSNNIVGGSPQTIQAAPGTNLVLSLQLVSTTELVTGFDYWLSQFSGPGAGVFSITGRDVTGTDYPHLSWGNEDVTTTNDVFGNSTSGGIGHPDGIADNRLAPRNGPSLGASAFSFVAPGIHQLATFTLTISLGAAPGLYQIRTFDYPGNGWGDNMFITHDFTAHAAINVQVVPEPATWWLVCLGIVAVFGSVARPSHLERRSTQTSGFGLLSFHRRHTVRWMVHWWRGRRQSPDREAGMKPAQGLTMRWSERRTALRPHWR